MAEEIKAVMIFEILGKPAEHLIETLRGIIDKLGKEKGVKVIEKKIREPKSVENSELFSSFAEVEIEFDSLQKLLTTIFNYMPAHIDILGPSELRIKNFDLCSVCNDLMTKLHAYDGIAKTLVFEKSNLIAQLNQLAANFEAEKKARESKKIEKKSVKKTKKKSRTR